MLRYFIILVLIRGYSTSDFVDRVRITITLSGLVPGIRKVLVGAFIVRLCDLVGVITRRDFLGGNSVIIATIGSMGRITGAFSDIKIVRTTSLALLITTRCRRGIAFLIMLRSST